MNCDAPLSDLTFSPNRTYVKQTSSIVFDSGSSGYFQNNRIPVKNTISSSFYDYDEEFKPQTFISKIGIYDENKNLIAIANLAKPVKKKQDRDYTFRLKLDI